MLLLLIRIRIYFRPTLDPAPPDPCCFRAIVDEAFLEPRMPECLLSGEAFGRVVDEYFLEEVEELLVERAVGRDDVLVIILVSCQKLGGIEKGLRERLTERGFIALTYFFEAFDVSWLG